MHFNSPLSEEAMVNLNVWDLIKIKQYVALREINFLSFNATTLAFLVH